MGAIRRSFAAAAALLLAVLPATAVGAPASGVPTATSHLATVVALRAAHHPGYDRVVLEFDGSRAPSATVR